MVQWRDDAQTGRQVSTARFLRMLSNEALNEFANFNSPAYGAAIQKELARRAKRRAKKEAKGV